MRAYKIFRFAIALLTFFSSNACSASEPMAIETETYKFTTIERIDQQEGCPLVPSGLSIMGNGLFGCEKVSREIGYDLVKTAPYFEEMLHANYSGESYCGDEDEFCAYFTDGKHYMAFKYIPITEPHLKKFPYQYVIIKKYKSDFSYILVNGSEGKCFHPYYEEYSAETLKHICNN